MAWWQADFPHLREEDFTVTSPETHDYNCIAWAAEEDDRWWWPARSPFAYWPPSMPLVTTLENFVSVFQAHGYELTEDDRPESGFKKVAIYVDDSGTPTHMSRQLGSGAWTSKLGPSYDIDHNTLQSLEGGTYGHIAQILKRQHEGGEQST